MSLLDVTLGTDPEFFVERTTGVIPAFYALGGDRDIALPFGEAYCDGAAVEMTVEHANDPAIMAMRLGANIRALRTLVDGDLTVRSNGFVAQQYIDALSPDYGKRASLQILGCDRDVRVYPWAKDIERPDPKTYPWRTLGGHVHIGVGKTAITNLTQVNYTVALCDALMGTAGTYLCDEQESRDRKKLYGKSGTIRLKEYGAIEYRALPAKALASTPGLAVHMFSLAQKIGWLVGAVMHEGASALLDLLGGYDTMFAVSTAIDEHDVPACRSFQREIVKRVDAHAQAPNLGAHVLAIQSMQLPVNFGLEW